MASSHFGSSTKRSSRVCKSFQLVKPNQYSSTSMFGGRGHQSHKGRRGAIRWLFVASQRTLCRGQVENLEPQRSRRTREVRRESPSGIVLNRTLRSYFHTTAHDFRCASARLAKGRPFPDRGLFAAGRQGNRDGR